MIQFAVTATVLVIAYLLGSIPTALIISTKIKGIDIRSVGDGNTGARNTFHEIGPKFGIIVAAIDFCKGALPVFLAYMLDLNLGWQILAAILSILGHDFPLFANLKGGQGTATSLGTMLVLFPLPTLVGLAIYGMVFLVIKNSNIGCSIGGATIALILGISQQWLLLGYAVAAFLFIPIKLFIDRPRRRAIGVAKHVDLV
ncbi:glycerol-3-phosphate acyltransferase [Chloroflexota bacterium]